MASPVSKKRFDWNEERDPRLNGKIVIIYGDKRERATPKLQCARHPPRDRPPMKSNLRGADRPDEDPPPTRCGPRPELRGKHPPAPA